MPSPYHVLYLDDDEDFLSLVQASLASVTDALTIEPVTDPSVALDRIRAGDATIDCLLTDYDMPAMDGLELLRAVREHDPELPVILYTGRGSEEIAAEAIRDGVTDYLQKQGGRDHAVLLENRIGNAIRSAKDREAAALRLDALDAAREGIAIFHPDGTLAYANPMYRELYGYDLEEAVGKPWTEFHPTQEIEVIETEVLPEVETTGRWDGPGVGIRKDASEFTESKSISKLPNGGFVVIVLEASVGDAKATNGEAEGDDDMESSA